MRIRPGIVSALLAGVVWLPFAGASSALEFSGLSGGQALLGPGLSSGTVDGMEAAPDTNGQVSNNLIAANDPNRKLCADGTRAIDQGRWSDAVKIFTQVANQHGDHSDAALYWKAYAENKLGQFKPAANSCTELRNSYPKSRWIDDCGALEVELHAKSGERVIIEPGQSDDVKLLALNAMMRQNEPLALAEIQDILNGDSSEKLKKEAEFILGHHYSDVTYAQVVRISYVEGDVRIQRGEPNGKASIGTWERAVADLPLETGFSLVTGTGRAEIEFENASTLYLGENSVLTFNDMHTTAGIPFTELALLSGTVSLHIHPYVAGEKFVLHTPTDDIISKFPDKTFARVESFSDALSITPLEGGEVRLPGVSKESVVPGRTWIHWPGQLSVEQDAGNDQEFSAWDKWVSDRVAQRDAAIAAVMEASGLPAPIPGMADMNGQGKFFDCAPYGTCWEPNGSGDEDQGENQKPGNQKPGLMLASFHFSGQPAHALQAAPASPLVVSERELDFPCTPGALRYQIVKDPATGKQTVIDRSIVPSARFDWAVCHTGSWIRHKRHYVWVAGTKRHHVEPVRWIKSGHKVGFVPLHPFDVKGQPAINRKNDVFTVGGKNDFHLELVKFDPDTAIEFLKEPPKEFRNSPMRPLAMMEAPHMEAHPFSRPLAGKSIEVAKAGVPIRFDPKSQSFLMSKQEMRGGKTTTVSVPMTNHGGTLQTHGGSFSGGNGFHGGSSVSGGGSRGGGSGGSSSGGGASHGGGTVSSSSSTSSSSSSAASSASGSSHH